MKKAFALVAVLMTISVPASAHYAGFIGPGPGMHFTQGTPLVVYADLVDDREGKGIIVCPPGQTVSNHDPPPDYSAPRAAECSGGGKPTGWPQFQLLIDGVVQTDAWTKGTQVPNTTSFDHNINCSPIDLFPFSADTTGLAPGMHQVVVRGKFSADAITIDTVDSVPIAITIDAPPTAMKTVTLSADLTGKVDWENVVVVGNGHAVTASGNLVIKNSLVTGLSGLTGSIDGADIENSIFEDTGPVKVTIGNGAATVKNNEFRANNRLTFVPDDPQVPYMLTFNGTGGQQKLFQGNRIGAGKISFGDNWLIGGDTDDATNILIGPRCVLEVGGSNVTVRGNYGHHNYRGGWSQGYNFYYQLAGGGVLTEHNFLRDASWPVQWLAGEFRYNVVYGYGHTWVRTTAPNTSIHHNLFLPIGAGGLSAGIQCYGGETGMTIYNNTFDGGGSAVGDFAGPTIDMSGGSQVASFRNNLVTFSRNQNNDSPGDPRVTGGQAGYQYADYNAFYSPDNDNKTNYDFDGAGAHDVSGTGAIGVKNGQLAANPFSGQRIKDNPDGVIDGVIDEAAIWQKVQRLSYVLALFRARYTPAAKSPVIDAGDPKDKDSKGRLADIGAIDVGGHDLDKVGTFGMPPSELVPPTVTLTAPSEGATLTGNTTLTATADDNAGGSGVVLVQFLVDGATVQQTSTKPYAAAFNTAILKNGKHAFSAKAWDAAGNFAVSAMVMATTDNVSAGVTTAASSASASSGTNGSSSGSTGSGAGGGSFVTSAGPGGAGGSASSGGGGGGGGGKAGGCACALADGGGAPGGSVLALVGLVALARRRRRGY